MVTNAKKFSELKEKERQARKQILINSAISLFSKKGFFEVGLKEVAEAAGISTATIYRYFPSQEDLFFEAFLMNISSLSKDFELIVQKDESNSIEQFASKIIDHLFKNEFVFQMIAHLMLRDDLNHPVFRKFDEVTKIFFNLFTQLIESYGIPKKEARQYSHSFVASVAGIFMTFRLHPTKSRDEAQGHILKLVRSVATLYSDKLQKIRSGL